MKPSREQRIVFCSCPDSACAETLATTLVSKRLAACVNIVPGVKSVYRWQNKIEIDSECQLIIKTSEHCLKAVEAEIIQLHPYELPELIAVTISEGSAAYLGWIQENT